MVMMPLLLFMGRFFAGYDTFYLPKFVTLFTYIYELAMLFFIAFLCSHRRKAFVCAAFVYCMINMIEHPIIFLLGTITQPLMNMEQFMNEIMFQTPVFFSVYVFIYNIVLMCSCFLAAHWLHKTKENPPQFMVSLFTLIFIVIIIIHYVWARDISKIITTSFFPSALLGIFFLIIVPILFYIFSRFITEKEIVTSGEGDTLLKQPAYSKFTQQLSRREIDVVKAIMDGNVSYKELASVLNISPNTVKTHLQHIYQTTGVSNVAALITLLNGYSVPKS
jgi:DNA-binding CsgD family transcriptional regulator